MAELVVVTGGLGYIGSHTVIELVQAGFKALILDNLHNSSANCFLHIQRLLGSLASNVEFLKMDVREEGRLEEVFTTQQVYAVVHFAALKAVAESVEKPLDYFDVNVGGTINLLKAMRKGGCNRLVYSSSACVYGTWGGIYKETDPLEPINPYGHSKVMSERIIAEHCKATPALQAFALRYFNPIGAHPSGLIGEFQFGRPNNLIPYIQQVVSGLRPVLSIYGNDYKTPDGTCTRDYIHVVDLAVGHVQALAHLSPGLRIYNLGTGEGTTVLGMVAAYSTAIGREVPYEIVGRRPGDADVLQADPQAARAEIGWKTKYSVEDMCRDSFRWTTNYPHGYDGPQAS